MLRAVFGVDPKLSDEFHICVTPKSSHKCEDALVYIQFDNNNDEHMLIFETSGTHIIRTINVPKNATRMTITSDNNIMHYGSYWATNSSIISIDEFTSDSITDSDFMFFNFDNLREVKNINLKWDKIINANNMCANWKSFNGVLPKNFCKNMKSLEYANYMFDSWKSYNQKLPNDFCSNMTSLEYTCCMFNDWKSYNQELPKYFCSNMASLRDAKGMFKNWESFNQKLPNNFCSNMVSLRYTNYMFFNWNSYKQELPDTFFFNTSYISDTEYMFWGWYNCYNTPKYDLPEFVYNYKQKDLDELNELLKKEEVIDYQLMNKLTNKTYCLCIKGSIDHYLYIKNGEITPFHNIFRMNLLDEAIYLIKDNDFITIN